MRLPAATPRSTFSSAARSPCACTSTRTAHRGVTVSTSITAPTTLERIAHGKNRGAGHAAMRSEVVVLVHRAVLGCRARLEVYAASNDGLVPRSPFDVHGYCG